MLSEHLHRYFSTLEFIQGKRVLDIASGEGYGTALLANSGAAHVVGVDIDKASITRAQRIYGQSDNLTFLTADIRKPLPIDTDQFDIVICFETLEHIKEQDALLQELDRVLASDGVLFISTPDKLVSQKRAEPNEYHEKELLVQEFKDLVQSYFPQTRTYLQRFVCGSMIIPENTGEGLNPTHYWQRDGFLKYHSTEMPLDMTYAIIVASRLEAPKMKQGLLHDGHILAALRKQLTEARQP